MLVFGLLLAGWLLQAPPATSIAPGLSATAADGPAMSAPPAVLARAAVALQCDGGAPGTGVERDADDGCESESDDTPAHAARIPHAWSRHALRRSAAAQAALHRASPAYRGQAPPRAA